MTSAQYLKMLKEFLEAKDPRTLSAGLKRGSLLFVFRDGPSIERLTIRIDKKLVEVVEGAHSLSDEAVLLIRGTLAGWLRYTGEPTQENLQQIELYGDLGLLTTLSSLIQTKRSAISARFFNKSETDSRSDKNRRK